VDAESWSWAEGVMVRAQEALARVAEAGWEWWPGDTGEEGTARALASQGPADDCTCDRSAGYCPRHGY